MAPQQIRHIPLLNTTEPSTAFVKRNQVGGRRVLCLIRGDQGYGVRRATLGMANEFRENSVRVGFVTTNPGPLAREIAAADFPLWILDNSPDQTGIRRRGLGFLNGVRRLLNTSSAGKEQLRDLIESFKPDWLHVGVNSLLILAGMAARPSNTPVFWHIHNTVETKLPFGAQALGLQLLCRLLRVTPLANSGHTAASLGKAICRPHVLYPGVDPRYFSPDAVFRSLQRDDPGLDGATPVFLIAARMVPEKAQDKVIEAAIKLLKAGRRLALVLVGGPIDTPYFRTLQRMVTDTNLGASIRLVGPVDDPRPYYAMADVVINSRAKAEPFGLTIVEAMLMERPVVACALGGPSETVVDGGTGWLIDESSVGDFQAGMLRALHDRDLWEQMGRDARRRALANFSLQATTRNYLAIVDRNRTSSGSICTHSDDFSKQHDFN